MKKKQETELIQLGKCAVERFLKKTIHEGASLQLTTLQAYKFCPSLQSAILKGYQEAMEIMKEDHKNNSIFDLSAIQPLDSPIERLLQVVNEESLVFSPEKKQESGGENLVKEQEEISLELSGPADQLIKPIEAFEGILQSVQSYSKQKFEKNLLRRIEGRIPHDYLRSPKKLTRSNSKLNLLLKGSQFSVSSKSQNKSQSKQSGRQKDPKEQFSNWNPLKPPLTSRQKRESSKAG